MYSVIHSEIYPTLSVPSSFVRFTQEFQTFTPKDKLLLGLSGGVDSVVLYELLKRQKFSFACAHANFGLRSAASQADEEFVRAITTKDQIPLFCKKFETLEFAKSKKLSVQMAARELRYDWFSEIMKIQNFTYLLLAHHADDILETSLMHLIKGTSLKGLFGIPINQNKVIRPLAFLSKQEIREWAKEEKLTWREDASNQETKYQRNYIRHRLIPIGKAINPSWEKTHVQTAKKLREATDIFEVYKNQVRESSFSFEKEVLKVNIGTLIKHKVNAYLLFALLEPYGFTYSDAEQICTQLLPTTQNTVGKVFYSKSHCCLKDRLFLFITPKKTPQAQPQIITPDTKKITLGDTVLTLEFRNRMKTIIRDPNVACLDLDKLTFPLTLRHWQKGDCIVPLGMCGRKKVSDLLTDKKVPRHQKEHTLVIGFPKVVVWVVGYQIHNDYKVTEATEQVLLIKRLVARDITLSKDDIPHNQK